MGLSRLEWLNLDHSHKFNMYVRKTLIQFWTLIVLYIYKYFVEHYKEAYCPNVF